MTRDPSDPDLAATRSFAVGVGTATFPAAGPPPDPSTPRPVNTPVVGPPGYEIVRRLDEGGMGTVFLAREVALDRPVALKVMKLPLFADDADARARFAREVRAMAHIEHPNLVPIYHSGEFRGVPFFAMRYLAGGTLAGVRPRPAAAAGGADLLRRTARGVAALHAAGILHRDLKPANVLLDEAGVPLVADFGLVRWLDEADQTVTGPCHGTPPYMSPEQTLGHSRRLLPACDVWALGVIGYELLTGRRPFVATHRDDLFDLIRGAEPAHPCRLRRDLPEPLAEVLLRCLRKDPAERYADAAALADDLDRAAAGQSLASRPAVGASAPVADAVPSTVTVVVPPPRPTRRRALVAGAAALAGVAAGVRLFQRTFAERVIAALSAGNPYTLVGETGPPEWSRLSPAEGGKLTAEAGGPAVLSAEMVGRFPHAFLELFGDPLPVPVRLEAELRWDAPPASESRMAVFVGYRGWPAADGDWQTAVVARQAPARAAPGQVNAMPEEYSVGAVVEPPLTVPNSEEVVFGRPMPRPATAPPPAAGEWVPLTVWLPAAPADGAGGTAFGASVASKAKLTAARYREMIKRHPRPAATPPPVAPDFAAAADPFGPGLGVYVRFGRVALRNVRLVPI